MRYTVTLELESDAPLTANDLAATASFVELALRGELDDRIVSVSFAVGPRT